MKVQDGCPRCDLGEDCPTVSHQDPDNPVISKRRLHHKGSSTEKKSCDTSQERGSEEAREAKGGHGWKAHTAVWGQSGFMPPVLKTMEGKINTCKEGRIFYPLPKIRLIMNADDHSTDCKGHLFLK